MDTEQTLKTLAEMRHYFAECAKNAAPGSKARETFTEYTATLVEIAQGIREREREEVSGDG